MKRIRLYILFAGFVTIISYLLFVWFDSKIPLTVMIQLKADRQLTMIATADFGNGYDKRVNVLQKYSSPGESSVLTFHIPLKGLRKVRKRIKCTILEPNSREGTLQIESISFKTLGGIKYRWDGKDAFSILKPLKGVSTEIDSQSLLFKDLPAGAAFELTYGFNDIYKKLFHKFCIYYIIFSILLGFLCLLYFFGHYQSLQNPCFSGRFPPPAVLLKIGMIFFTLVLSIVLIGSYVYHRHGMVIADELITIAPRVKNLYNGNFSFFADIWRQHNAHRSVFPVATILLLAPITDWNINYETAIGIFFFIAVAIVILINAKSLFLNSGLHLPEAFYPIVALLVFSLTQQRVFDMGYLTLQYGFCFFSVVAGIFLITHNNLTRWRFSLAVCCGIVASFSFGTGLAFWPAGFIAILIRGIISRKNILPLLCTWIGVSIIIVMLYHWGFVHKHSFNYTAILKDLTGFIKFAIIFLSAPICNFSRTGAYTVFVFWICIMILLTLIWYGTGQRTRDLLSYFAPYLVLGFYSLVNAVLIGMGRLAAFGIDQALWREYKTIATPMWILPLIFFFFLQGKLYPSKIKLRFQAMLGATGIMIVIIVAILIFSNFVGLKMMNNRHDLHMQQVENLLSIKDFKKDRILLIKSLKFWAKPAQLRASLSFLKENKLSIFRD